MSQSASKENINKSYYDLTSPLTTLQKNKQKTLLKSSIQNSYINKVELYKNHEKSKLNESFKANNKQIHNIKAGSLLYKLPQFTTPQINAEISQEIKLKAIEIKKDMTNNLPDVLNSIFSLPSIHQPKSSNYNPKKLQNLLGHRSEVLQLQDWLRTTLQTNPPTTPQQLIEYKQMIMGVGMKDLIRIINKRCLQEGKMVEQVWQLTWGICKQIIIYMSQRAKKCEEILQTEINSLNKGYKRNFDAQQNQLSQLRKKIEQLQTNQKQMTLKIQHLKRQNDNMNQINHRNSLENTYCNEQFLNVLQQNLAMYLRIGDKKKRDWIKKMYHQVSNARQSIQKSLKQKVNVTVVNKIKQEQIFQDKLNDDVMIDAEGNLILNSQPIIKQQTFDGPQEKEYQKDQKFQGLKQQLIIQFQLKQIGINSQQQHTYTDNQVQSQYLVFQEKEVQTDQATLQQKGVNTEQNEFENEKKNEKGLKNKQGKIKSQKKPARGPSKSKVQRLSSQINDFNQPKQNGSISSQQSIILNKSITAQQKDEKNKNQEVSYVCKQCFCKKSKQEALNQIQYQLKQRQILIELKQKQFETELQKNMMLQLSKHNSNDINQRGNSTDKLQVKQQRNVIVRKNQTKRKSVLSKFSQKKSYEQKQNTESSRQEENKNNLIQKQSKSKLKKALSQISQNRIVQDTQYDSQAQNNMRMEDQKLFSHTQNYNDKRNNQFDFYDQQNRFKNKNSDSNYQENKKENNRKNRRRDSSILHDISYKKQAELVSNLKQAGYNSINQDQQKSGTLMAKLPLTAKQPYFKFFTEQITEANKQFVGQIIFMQGTNQTILNNYFNMVQQINSIPQYKIQLSQKQMLTTIQKNLMPIILQLLNSVKKAVFKKSVDQTIRTFQSLPFILMNKFSTKYGVKILATKNMKLLLSSLKKIQTITDRYKSLRLMLFTDCRAMYSEDLFVYLLVLALVTPHLDVERPINYEEVSKIRQLCQKYLTKDKKIFQEFDFMTKQAMSLNNTQQKLGCLKLAPLLRSIITSYRMVKINRIEEIGFIFLMLKKQNYLQYQVFSFFISCFRLETDIKVKIVKNFLANCDIKTKQKKMAISESGFSRFLIKCPQFNFQNLNSVILKQKLQYEKYASNQATKKKIQTNKRMSQQTGFNKGISSHLSLKMQDDEIQGLKQNRNSNTENRLKTEKSILLESQYSSPKLLLNKSISEKEPEKHMKVQIKQQQQVFQGRNQKRHFSLKCNQQQRPQIQQKVKQYSYFTYQIAKFLQNQEETKYMQKGQKQFVENYLIVHVMCCQIDDLIGIIDYFSNDMLEIICYNSQELKINSNTDE